MHFLFSKWTKFRSTIRCPRKNWPLNIFRISPPLSLWLKLFLLWKDSAWNSLQNHIWLGLKIVLDIFEKRWNVKTYKKLSRDQNKFQCCISFLQHLLHCIEKIKYITRCTVKSSTIYIIWLILWLHFLFWKWTKFWVIKLRQYEVVYLFGPRGICFFSYFIFL